MTGFASWLGQHLYYKSPEEYINLNQSEKFGAYKTLIIHLSFKTIGGIKYDNYNGVITIDIDIDSIDVEDHLKEELLKL